jgi:thymidylate synthase (FAD)
MSTMIKITPEPIKVLDNGYVRLVDTLGDDLSIVNAARVSYDKESTEFTPKDEKLLSFLLREGHTSPFRHAALTFEVYAPLFAARQWWKYAVSSTHVDDQNGWNESSRRYITEEEQFYVPSASSWRSKPENSKQGSGEPIHFSAGAFYTNKLNDLINQATELYHEAMNDDVAPELARLFLPAYGLYVRWRWTVSLQGAVTFLDQRLPHDAQFEIQEYARAVQKLTTEAFPNTMKVYQDLK